MLTVREPEEIFQTDGAIQNGTFTGRWHFSFGAYFDPENTSFGALRVLNDDTLSPGATWPLHPHREIEVVTYCAGGEFRHADEHGKGGVLKKGWVQHTTVGSGMWHSEINNRIDAPMRFIQMWFYPEKKGLQPSVEQKEVERSERTDKLLPIVAPEGDGALPIHADARVLSCFLEKDKTVGHRLAPGRGAYVYVLEGGPIKVNGNRVKLFGAAKAVGEEEVNITALEDTEMILVEVAVS